MRFFSPNATCLHRKHMVCMGMLCWPMCFFCGIFFVKNSGDTLQGTKISTLGNGKSSTQKCQLVGDMLVFHALFWNISCKCQIATPACSLISPKNQQGPSKKEGRLGVLGSPKPAVAWQLHAPTTPGWIQPQGPTDVFSRKKIFCSLLKGYIFSGKFQTQLQTQPSWWFQPLWKILVKMEIFPK